jgi:hypothetical protein
MPSLNLSGSAISYTYQRLLQTDGVNVYDGTGSLFNLPLSGSFSGSITGSLFGTASYALQALSSSYALSASYVPNASSFPFTGSAEITGSLTVTGSIRVTGDVTASYFVGIIDGGTF